MKFITLITLVVQSLYSFHRNEFTGKNQSLIHENRVHQKMLLKRNKNALVIEDTTLASTTLCSGIFSSPNGIQLSNTGNLLVSSPVNNSIWAIIWEHIDGLGMGNDTKAVLKQHIDGTKLTFEQSTPSLQLLQEDILNTFVEYTDELNQFTPSDLIQVCRIKIMDPDIEAILYDIFTVYNGGVPDWFFCTEISINFYIVPDDSLTYGANSLKFNFEIVFENNCDINGPTSMAPPVVKIDGLDWAVVF
eukprot:GAHX01003501.1.p1 GENE.GAHX01003501.1~~GAHX01003501.1.p1  ORF type:complete len:247 (+),score=31.41 GAHX01003501.1:42-782(+)